MVIRGKPTALSSEFAYRHTSVHTHHHRLLQFNSKMRL